MRKHRVLAEGEASRLAALPIDAGRRAKAE
jgi:hypothetical protein